MQDDDRYSEAALQRLKEDPRAAELKLWEYRVIEPKVPLVPGESRFYRCAFDHDFGSAKGAIVWKNDPGKSRVGSGHGFDELHDRPSFHHDSKKPGRFPDAWQWNGYWIAGQNLLDVLLQWDPEAVVSVPIDYVFSDGQKPGQQYHFIDVIRHLPAVDWENSRVGISLIKDQDAVVFSATAIDPRFRPDISSDVHIFRPDRSANIYVSKDLAKSIRSTKVKQIRFFDPATGLSFGE